MILDDTITTVVEFQCSVSLNIRESPRNLCTIMYFTMKTSINRGNLSLYPMKFHMHKI